MPQRADQALCPAGCERLSSVGAANQLRIFSARLATGARTLIKISEVRGTLLTVVRVVLLGKLDAAEKLHQAHFVFV